MDLYQGSFEVELSLLKILQQLNTSLLRLQVLPFQLSDVLSRRIQFLLQLLFLQENIFLVDTLHVALLLAIKAHFEFGCKCCDGCLLCHHSEGKILDFEFQSI